ncbi:MAG: hypothetical protein V1494_01115 [Candidatus Diapherotrites archaeon]
MNPPTLLGKMAKMAIMAGVFQLNSVAKLAKTAFLPGQVGALFFKNQPLEVVLNVFKEK